MTRIWLPNSQSEGSIRTVVDFGSGYDNEKLGKAGDLGMERWWGSGGRGCLKIQLFLADIING